MPHSSSSQAPPTTTASGTFVLSAMLAGLLAAACGQAPQPPSPVAASAAERPATTEQEGGAAEAAPIQAPAEWTYRIIDAPNGTFGYDILRNGRLFVHQTNLPGLPGTEGCRTREGAGRLALFVMGKIHRGEMPPSVTPAELDSLQAH